MKIFFSKYHGTGNDFIIIDNRELQWKPKQEEITLLCDRHFGIGADGLMLLTEKPGVDFYMTYYNSDGRESTMCGNGGRCMIIFARSLGLIGARDAFSRPSMANILGKSLKIKPHHCQPENERCDSG